MSWKKHFSPVNAKNNADGVNSPFSNASSGRAGPASANYSSFLPDVYAGAPNRIDRYGQYNVMDQDSEVNAALDILAEFCTQKNPTNGSPFSVEYRKPSTNAEVNIIKQYLQQWSKLQKFETRMFRIMRNIFKYGDQFFIRDPETFKWLHVDPANITSVIVNESEGKIPVQYKIQNINFNFVHGIATTPHETSNTRGPVGIQYTPPGGSATTSGQPVNSSFTASRFSNGQDEYVIDAEHVVHLSLSEGLDNNYPFGSSLLETIYKVYKQKELLEDAIIIYRVQRAPERRVFYVDVGNMPPHLAMSFVERVKTEIHQRRIPSSTGGGQNLIDSSYNPLGITEDYFFPACLSLDTMIPLLDGRELSLNEIIDEYESGKVNYVYGLNKDTHELESAKIDWAGITRKNAEVLRVHLDNGEYVDATPDHKFILRDGTEVMAENLVEGNSLMPLELRDGYSGPKQKNKKYTRYRSNCDGNVKFVHATIANKPQGKDTQVHHVDFNSKNNNPTNLQVMKTEDHIALHKAVGTYSLQKQWSSPEGRKKLIDGIHALYENADAEFRKKISERNSKNSTKAWANKSDKEKKANNDRLHQEAIKFGATRKIKYDIAMFNEMVRVFDSGYNSVSKLTKELKEDEGFQSAFKKANPDIFRNSREGEALGVTDATLNKLVGLVGYKTFGDWKQDYTGIPKFSNREVKRQNHKVVRVERLVERIDTGDITISSASDSHWFGLSSGIYVHNSSEGRGSKVETLPGGQSLGEIDDLQYFTNKLVRGLRIPSSYLPTGADDSSSQFNDGRVGTAYIQELRFNTYCERLQTLVTEEFDQEFKRFLLKKGVNIDTSMFELKCHPPQNFAAYRQSEVDNARVGTYSQMQAIPFISNRFALKRFLGLSEEEIAENERLWLEENEDDVDVGNDPSAEMRDAGVSAAGIESDLGNLEDEMDMGEEPMDGGNLDDIETTTDQTVGPSGSGQGQ